jgi:hypothetical protein
MGALEWLVKSGLAVSLVAVALGGCGGDDGGKKGGETASGGASAGGKTASGGVDGGEASGGASAGGKGTGGAEPDSGAGGASTGGSDAGAEAGREAGPDDGGGNDAADSADAPARGVKLRFCNSIDDGTPLTLLLRVGRGEEATELTAITDACAPAEGQPCVTIPAGDAVTFELFDPSDTAQPLASKSLDLQDGDEVAVLAAIGAGPELQGGVIDGGPACSEYGLDDF